MKNILLLFGLSALISCSSIHSDTAAEEKKINQLLDKWHQAAAGAEYEKYFSMMSEQSVFIGTDATENWNKGEFMVWSKPYFDKGKAWNFTALERNIYFNETEQLAWFDELLNTQMKICRGSGVVAKEGDQWKIKHYVLSMTFPNDSIDAAIQIKAPIENEMIENLSKTIQHK